MIGAGKAGLVLAWNRETQKRIWQTSVGTHRNDTGPLPVRPVTVCPGFFGGVETPLAVADARVFVPVVDLCAQGGAQGYQSIQSLDPVRGTGEFAALSAATGGVLVERTLPQPDFGCARVASDVVFTSTFDGSRFRLRRRQREDVVAGNALRPGSMAARGCRRHAARSCRRVAPRKAARSPVRAHRLRTSLNLRVTGRPPLTILRACPFDQGGRVGNDREQARGGAVRDPSCDCRAGGDARAGVGVSDCRWACVD